jgi:hypothetical protein
VILAALARLAERYVAWWARRELRSLLARALAPGTPVTISPCRCHKLPPNTPGVILRYSPEARDYLIKVPPGLLPAGCDETYVCERSVRRRRLQADDDDLEPGDGPYFHAN